ncbi:enolase-phosphatase E1-like protein [Leptotrombidium deliense]|uniref:Enolase-phosphatase E1-like protein n=1 Tax=Leptotrombidium deliense TaxID=299467 RepID=A0A443SM59_9ACAR|nr:enolase-phosphatase E1-like protein [Leptotrombidium deliense]
MPQIQVIRPTNIIIDIYGTITSVKFVDELKEYAAKNIEKYLKDEWNDRKLVRLLDKLQTEATTLKNKEGMPPILDYKVKESDPTATQKSIENHISWRVKTHQESEYTLFLFNGIWEAGYKSGKLKSHVFDDVPKALNEWRMNQYIKIYTLSTGKRLGQHIFMKHTVHGDLAKLIANYFDCSTFGKEDRRSYLNIANAIRERPEKMLFLTDNAKEAMAAAEEKFKAILVVREGNDPLTDEDKKKFPVVMSLEEIKFIDPPTNEDSQKVNSKK